MFSDHNVKENSLARSELIDAMKKCTFDIWKRAILNIKRFLKIVLTSITWESSENLDYSDPCSLLSALLRMEGKKIQTAFPLLIRWLEFSFGILKYKNIFLKFIFHTIDFICSD